jgi:hypothetical protein
MDEMTMEQRILLLKCLDYDVDNMTDEEIIQASSKITLQDMADKWNEIGRGVDHDELYTIEQLKKQIKYSKNPLEVKMLNKKLNELYKRR